VGFVWTWWDGLSVAGSSSWNTGGEGGVLARVVFMAWSREGTGGLGVGCRMERGKRGTRLGVGVALYCRLQCGPVATLVGAGDVLDRMVA